MDTSRITAVEEECADRLKRYVKMGEEGPFWILALSDMGRIELGDPRLVGSYPNTAVEIQLTDEHGRRGFYRGPIWRSRDRREDEEVSPERLAEVMTTEIHQRAAGILAGRFDSDP